MRRVTYPQPRERSIRQYRRVRRELDLEPVSRIGVGGFGDPRGYRGSYAERPGYWMRRGDLYPPEPEGSGWPSEVHELPEWAEAEHLRAQRDRDLAHAVDVALYQVIGRQADRVSVYADDATITLEGELSDYPTARDAREVARRIPGVRRVRDRLCWWR